MTDIEDDALALLRESQDRVLGREGIPMILVLVDETSSVPVEPDAGPAAAEGARLASVMDELARQLSPTGRDDDLGRVGTVLQAASYRDFGQGRTVL